MAPFLLTKIIPACLILYCHRWLQKIIPLASFSCLIWEFFCNLRFLSQGKDIFYTPEIEAWEEARTHRDPKSCRSSSLSGAGLWGGKDALPRLGCKWAHLIWVPYVGRFNPWCRKGSTLRENSREFWLWQTWRKNLKAAKVYLAVLNLCLHQPLKCISQNSSARTSFLLFPQFSSFHVVQKKTQSCYSSSTGEEANTPKQIRQWIIPPAHATRSP